MSGAKHTPGPWTHTEGNGGFVHSRADGRRDLVASVYPCAPDGAEPLSPFPREPELDANCRLIASAPDLLEAAQIAEAFFYAVAPESNERQILQAAIAKATGQ